jgi:hypothetical protein
MTRRILFASLLTWPAAAIVFASAHAQPPFRTAEALSDAYSYSDTHSLARETGTRPSDEEILTFARIYAALQEADEQFERKMADAYTRQEAQNVAEERQRACRRALADHGWTRSKFDSVAAAINDDPALVERTIELLEAGS